ncbi:MAG: HAD-IB family hydrolase [Chitinophagaceae bacterium]|nr:HAD-IB family hydrolase [Chitinophagaceae bacterium]MCW5926928.1 HAD-IB family hydrolase [Chitinophagaceae bacterium]
MRKIAFFDFDGTITYKDTLLEIVRFNKGDMAWALGMMSLSPWLVAMKLKLTPNDVIKQKYLTRFFGGTREEVFKQVCDDFVSQKLPPLIRPLAMEEIKKHQRNQTEVVVVSASPEDWLKGWCRTNDIVCIGTRLEKKNGFITGRIEGKNCYGPEKVNRIRQLYNLDEYDEIFSYGDSGGDREMLALANFSHYKPFR